MGVSQHGVAPWHGIAFVTTGLILVWLMQMWDWWKKMVSIPIGMCDLFKTCWEVRRFAGSHRTKSIRMGKDYEFPWVVHAFSTTAVIHLEYLGVTLRIGRTCPLACPYATWLCWDGAFSWSKCCPLGYHTWSTRIEYGLPETSMYIPVILRI